MIVKPLYSTPLRLELEGSRYEQRFEVEISDETSEYYLVVDQHGFETPFGKYLIAANGIKVEGRRLTLSPHQYRRHFGLQVELSALQACKDFWAGFSDVVAHRELVFGNAAYFLIQLPFVCAGGLNLRLAEGTTLGGLLENWLATDELLLDDHPEMGRLMAVAVQGSFSSGIVYRVVCWSAKQNRLLVLENNGILHRYFFARLREEGYAVWHEKLRRVAGAYPQRLPLSHVAMQDLLAELAEKKLGGAGSHARG